MFRNILVCALMASTALAAAQDTWSADSAGGPLTLPEEIQAAFDSWHAAGVQAAPAQAEGADTLFRFASPELLGPDTVTLTLQRTDGVPGLEILVQPDLYRDYPVALVHEAGLTMGLTAGAEGVLRPGLVAGGAAEVSAAEAAMVVSAAAAIPGDLTADGVVDFDDLLALAAQFGRRGINLPADLDGDGVVTMDDLAELRQLYEFLPPAERETEPETEPEPEPVVPAPADEETQP